MGRKIALFLVFAFFWVASSRGEQHPQPQHDGPTIPTVSRSDRFLLLQTGITVAMQDNECGKCAHALEEGGKCADQTKACKDGSVRACYLAAACACQCQLDAGGCGSDRDALKQCIEKNEKNAHDME